MTDIRILIDSPDIREPAVRRVLGPGQALLLGRAPDYNRVINPPGELVDRGRQLVRLLASPTSGLSSSHLLLWNSGYGLRVRATGRTSVWWQTWGYAMRAEPVTRHPGGELVETPLVTLWLAREPMWRIGIVSAEAPWPVRPTVDLGRTRPDEFAIRPEAAQVEAVLAVFAEYLHFPARHDPKIRKSADLPADYDIFRKRLARLWHTAAIRGLWKPPDGEQPTFVSPALLQYLLRTASLSYDDVARAVAGGTARYIDLVRPIPLWPTAAAPDRL